MRLGSFSANAYQKRAILLSAIWIASIAVLGYPDNNSSELKAFRLSIESNFEFIKFDNKFPVWVFGVHLTDDAIRSLVMLVPLNREIINAAVSYKAFIDKLSQRDAMAVLSKAQDEFLDGGESVFVIFVINDDHLDKDATIYFKDFKKNTFLMDEYGRKYYLKRYTRIFDGKLSPGWNKGYLYFGNFRDSRSNSYSVHFNELILDARVSVQEHASTRASWAFSFDESEVGFLALLRKGIDEEVLRKNYGIETYKSTGLELATFMDVVGFILTVVSLVR